MLFVLGFTLVFLALGAGASAFGTALKTQKTLIARIGGGLVIIFRLWTGGAIKLPFLEREQRMYLEEKPVG